MVSVGALTQDPSGTILTPGMLKKNNKKSLCQSCLSNELTDKVVFLDLQNTVKGSERIN